MMTPKQRDEMQERKRAGYRRRLQGVRVAHDLPALTNRQREQLLDQIMNVQGEALSDYDLHILHRLATRGLCG